MINFLGVCQDYSFLSVILLCKRILEFICIIVPIALIVMATIDVTKVVMNPDNNTIKKVASSTIKRVIAAVCVFFVPMLVSLLLNMIGTTNYLSTDCWTNANTETIEVYKEAYEAQKEAEQEELDAESEAAEEERKVVAATREAAREENAEKAAEAAAAASANSTGTSTSLAAKFISVAADLYSQNLGEPNLVHYAYWGNYTNYPWCAAFVWYCAKQSGVDAIVYSNGYKTASVSALISHFKNTSGLKYYNSEFDGGNYTPKMGDIIFMRTSHVGIVEKVSGSSVWIYDGNCQDTVCHRSISLSSSKIRGYGVWE